MPSVRIKRFIQDPAHCATAACSAIANHYNHSIDYELTKKIAKKRLSRELESGLWTGQTGRLCNLLGFRKVTIVSSDLNILDYTWMNSSKQDMVNNLRKCGRSRKIDQTYRESARAMVKFLDQEDYQNKIVIDYNFGEYIRWYLDAHIPLMASFNWNMFFRRPKINGDGNNDPVKGESEFHEVVIHGYNNNYVYVTDSHHRFYKYGLKRFKKGKYRISWENLMTCMTGEGDLIIPELYDPEWLMA